MFYSALGTKPLPKENEIHNFGRHIPALHHCAFSFSYIHVVSEEDFKKIGQFWHFLPCPMGPRGVGNLKFTIYIPLVPKTHHIKFEKNWRSGYQGEVKNVQMCIDTTHHVWPHPGGKTSTPRIMKFKILVEILLLYITMHLVFFFYIHVVSEKKIF